MAMAKFIRNLFVGLAAGVSLFSAHAHADGRDQVVLHLLDYIAVEYPAFVKDGLVVDADEYREQVEFSRKVAEDVVALAPNPRRGELASAAQHLAVLIA